MRFVYNADTQYELVGPYLKRELQILTTLSDWRYAILFVDNYKSTHPIYHGSVSISLYIYTWIVDICKLNGDIISSVKIADFYNYL